MDHNIIEKFTTHLKSVLVRAYTLAHDLGESRIGTDHLLLSLLAERGSLGLELLEKAKITEAAVRAAMAERGDEARGAIERELRSQTRDPEDQTVPTLAPETKRAIEKAVLAANLYEHKYVGTEHLLLGLIQADEEASIRIMTALRVDLDVLRGQLAAIMKSTSRFPEVTEPGEEGPGGETSADGRDRFPSSDRKPDAKLGKDAALDFFTTDLTSVESQKRIDPVIGREKEIARMIQILSRRNKNNPILLGDPGVGKTAIVEGLARRMAEGAVPPILSGKRILALDLALVVAGTVYRGEFEARLKQIVDEVKSKPDVILFIDEVHNLSGAGSASGSMDAANILKPALARGEIRAIGATTVPEYKKSIESDPALDRRFQPIAIEEPSAEETETILRGIKTQYETFHAVRVTDEAIAAAVNLAGRYLHGRHFPDKAIDLIDEAAAAARIAAAASPEDMKIRALEAELKTVQENKEKAVRAELFTEAMAEKDRESGLAARIKVLKANSASTGPVAEISGRDVAAVVSSMTGVPLGAVLAEGTNELEDLETRLEKRIVGQTEAIKAVSDRIRRARAGLSRAGGPLASFLFLGPSGVGKTSLATALAEEVFHDPKALIRLDMSEFGEAFTVSKMLGSPAGYVGYRDATKLTDTVRRRPYSVVLFDEVEKAHPDVLNVLLQILEDGKLTDSTGRATHFDQTIVVLTSNVGSDRSKTGALGFASGDTSRESASDMRRDAKLAFRPELLNRLDKTVVFRKLETPDLAAVLAKEIAALNLSLKPRGFDVSLSKSALAHLTEKCRKADTGARAVRQIVQENVENELANHLLARRVKKRRRFSVDARKGELSYNVR